MNWLLALGSFAAFCIGAEAADAMVIDQPSCSVVFATARVLIFDYAGNADAVAPRIDLHEIGCGRGREQLTCFCVLRREGFEVVIPVGEKNYARRPISDFLWHRREGLPTWDYSGGTHCAKPHSWRATGILYRHRDVDLLASNERLQVNLVYPHPRAISGVKGFASNPIGLPRRQKLKAGNAALLFASFPQPIGGSLQSGSKPGYCDRGSRPEGGGNRNEIFEYISADIGGNLESTAIEKDRGGGAYLGAAGIYGLLFWYFSKRAKRKK